MTCDSRTHVNKKQDKLSLPSFSNVNLIVFDILIISSIKYYQIILYAPDWILLFLCLHKGLTHWKLITYISFSRKQFFVYIVYIVSHHFARIPEKRSFIKNGLLALCENGLEPKNFSAFGQGSILYIRGRPPRGKGALISILANCLIANSLRADWLTG